MDKKVMVVAVAAAVGAPALAHAQASTVQIYGSVRGEWSVRDEGTGRNKYNQMVNPGSSYIGFKGEEKMAGGMSAWFQCESTIDIGGAGTSLCMRNSAVGLKGGFGNVWFGNWDLPYKLASGSSYRPFDTTGATGPAALLHNETSGNSLPGTATTSATALVSTVQVGGSTVLQGATQGGATVFANTSTGNATSFHRRSNHMIQYHTPNWNGLTLMAAYTAKNQGTNTGAGANVPNIWSLGATYNNGPIYVGAGYEKHKSLRVATVATGNQGLDDKAWNINAAYTFASVGFKLGAIYERLDYSQVAGLSTKRNAYGFFGDWKMGGPHTLRAHYTVAGDSSGGGAAVGRIGGSSGAAVGTATGAVANTDNGAKMYALQYGYALSKRTEVNVFYVRLDNDRAALYRLQSGSSTNTGQDQNAYGMQVRHSF